MPYIPLGDKTVQNYIDMMSVYSPFNSLTQAQQIQYINFNQQLCAKISKDNDLEYYKSASNMATFPLI